jgi:hypothetical protein
MAMADNARHHECILLAALAILPFHLGCSRPMPDELGHAQWTAVYVNYCNKREVERYHSDNGPEPEIKELEFKDPQTVSDLAKAFKILRSERRDAGIRQTEHECFVELSDESVWLIYLNRPDSICVRNNSSVGQIICLR